MSWIAVLAAEEGHELAPMIMDPIWFPVIAAAILVTLGLVTFSFRDVANRHSHKTGGSTPHVGNPH